MTPPKGRDRYRPSTRGRRLPFAAALASALVAAACTGDQGRSGCSLSDKLVPACGVLLGITTEEQTAASLAAAEATAVRPYDFVYRFHDTTDVIPDATERDLVAQGRLLHLAIDVREFRAGGRTYGWKDVANGDLDARLRAQAAGIASLNTPVWVTFEHEPDNAQKAERGSGADFVKAWRHVYQVFRDAGATNAVWVWVVTGASDSIDRVAQFWPGNDVVDWVSWEAYNPSGCRTGRVNPARWQTFEQAMGVFVAWLSQASARVGIDPAKPWMISESGSVADPTNPDRRRQWYADIAGSLARHPQVKAVGLWDHTGNNVCDYRFSGRPDVQPGVNSTLSDPLLSQARRL